MPEPPKVTIRFPEPLKGRMDEGFEEPLVMTWLVLGLVVLLPLLTLTVLLAIIATLTLL